MRKLEVYSGLLVTIAAKNTKEHLVLTNFVELFAKVKSEKK